MIGAPDDVIHASVVAWAGRGVLICGASGSGKSGLALNLMALGAQLVSDDRTRLVSDGPAPLASAPEALAGLIEARGIGLLKAQAAGPVPVHLVVDLDLAPEERLPPPRMRALAGRCVPLLAGKGTPNLAASVLQWMKGGQVDVP